MNDGGGDYGAKRRSTGGDLNDMRILLPSQVLAFLSSRLYGLRIYIVNKSC